MLTTILHDLIAFSLRFFIVYPDEVFLIFCISVCVAVFLNAKYISRRLREYVTKTRLTPTVQRHAYTAMIIGAVICGGFGFYLAGVFLLVPFAFFGGRMFEKTVLRMRAGGRQKRLNQQAINFLRVLYQTMLSGEPTFSALSNTRSAALLPLREEVDYIVEMAHVSGLVSALRTAMETTESPYFREIIRILLTSEIENLPRTSTCSRLSRLYDALASLQNLQQSITALVAQTRYGQYAIMILVPLIFVINIMMQPWVIGQLGTLAGKGVVVGILLDETFVYLAGNKLLSGIELEF